MLFALKAFSIFSCVTVVGSGIAFGTIKGFEYKKTKQEQIQESTEETDEQKAVNEKIKELNQQINVLNSDIETINQTINTFEEEINTQNNELSTSNSNITLKNNELTTSTQTLTKSQQVVETAKQSVETQEQKLTLLEKDKKEKTQFHTVALLEKTTLESEISKINQEIKKETKKPVKQGDFIEVTQVDGQKAEEELQTTKTTSSSEKNKYLDNLQIFHEALKEDMQLLTKKEAKFKEEKITSEQNYDQANNKLTSDKADKINKEATLDVVQKENTKLTNSLSEEKIKQSSIEEAIKNKTQSLNQEKENLKTKHDELKKLKKEIETLNKK